MNSESLADNNSKQQPSQKYRKAPYAVKTTSSDATKHSTGSAKLEPADVSPSSTSITSAQITPATLGLGAYSSDDD